MLFDHYIFGDADASAHLPAHAKGMIGPASPRLFAQMRATLRRIFG